MSEDLSFVDRVHRDLGGVRWPEPAEIRGRARRRSRRTAVLAAAAVLVVLSGSTYALAGRPVEPAPQPMASAPQPLAPVTRAEIPREALLQQADLATKVDLELSESGLGGTVDVMDPLDRCARERLPGLTGEEARASRSQTLLRQRAGGGEHPLSDILVAQDLYRVTPQFAGSFFADLDRRIAACAEWREVRPGEQQGRPITTETTHRFQTPSRNFAGDESVLLHHTARAGDGIVGPEAADPPKPDTLAVVRVGDLVTVLMPGRSTTEQELLRLGAAAARRMCAGANPPC